MRRACLVTLMSIAAISAGPVRADVIITLEATDVQGTPITGPVAAGTHVFVDLLLSVDAEDNPLMDLRGIELNLEKSSISLEFDEEDHFEWMVQPAQQPSQYFPFNQFLRPSIVCVCFGTEPSATRIHLSDVPVKIAEINFVVQASGTLNVGNHPDYVGGGGALFTAGFTDIKEFSNNLGNIQGGTLSFEVTGTEEPDDDYANDNDSGSGNDNSGDNENDNGADGNVNENNNVSNDNSDNGNDNSVNANDNAPGGNDNGSSGNTNSNGSTGNANANASDDNENDNASVNDNGTGGNVNDNAPDGGNDNAANDNSGGTDNGNSNSGSGGGAPGFNFCGAGLLGPMLLAAAWLAFSRGFRRFRPGRA